MKSREVDFFSSLSIDHHTHADIAVPGAVAITIPKLVEMAAEQVDLACFVFFRAPGLCASLARDNLGRVRSRRPHRYFGSTGISQAAYRQAAPNHQSCGDVAAAMSNNSGG